MKTRPNFILRESGFTLVELVLAMGIFMVILIISTYGFESILMGARRESRGAKSNYEGVVGLEALRYDIEHAGFALPWSLAVPPASSFPETTVSSQSGVDPTSFNETVPSAIRSITDISPSSQTSGIHYLVIKSQVAALNATTKKWCYVNYSAVGSTNASTLAPNVSSAPFKSPESVIVVNPVFSTQGTLTDKQLLMKDSSTFSFSAPSNGVLTSIDNAFKPGEKAQRVLAYGLAPGAAVSMPYNRVDYFVNIGDPNLPASCSPGTGILYKRVATQGGGHTDYPLLNCVGDMQVEYQTGPSTWTPNIFTLTPAEIRSQLQNVQVYILSHEGGRDRNFVYPGTSIQVGDSLRPVSSGRTLFGADMQNRFGADWQHYRWKVYTVVARPKNLN